MQPLALQQRLDLGKNAKSLRFRIRARFAVAFPGDFVTQPAADHQVLAYRQFWKDSAVFRRKANAAFSPLVRRKLCQIFVAEKDLAGPERQKSHDAFDRGGLAGAIAS